MTAEDLTALVARRRDGLVRRDATTLATHYANDCVLESPSWGTVRGRQAVEKVFREFFAAFPNCLFEFGDFLIVGSRAAETVTIHGTNSGGFFGQAPTGRPFRLFMVNLLTVLNRGIVHERRVYDVGGFMLQLASDDGRIDTAQLYKATLTQAQTDHELRMAAEIQQALMPQALRKGQGYEVAASSRPCRAIGGDFIDYFTLADGGFAFVLGDVAGKGPAAALLAAVLLGVFTANAFRRGTPAVQMGEANHALVRREIDARFATAVYAVLTTDGRLTYCNGGHNPPLLVRENGIQRLETGGTVVGILKDAAFEEETVQLERGDILVAFSDGITEARDLTGEEFGEERLISCIDAHHQLSPAALLQKLFEEVQHFSAGGVQADDLTILILNYSGSPSGSLYALA